MSANAQLGGTGIDAANVSAANPISALEGRRTSHVILFLRHQPRRPPQAAIRPGRPAPTMGAGTLVNFGHVQHASGIVNIPHDRQSAQAGYSLAQDLETFGAKLCPLAGYSGDVRARSRQSGNKASGNRVARQCEDDRNTVCRLLCRQSALGPIRHNQIDLQLDELG